MLFLISRHAYNFFKILCIFYNIPEKMKKNKVADAEIFLPQCLLLIRIYLLRCLDAGSV